MNIIHKTIQRHIEAHGFSCVSNNRSIAICIPIISTNRLTGQLIKGNRIEHVSTLKQAYIAMGY